MRWSPGYVSVVIFWGVGICDADIFFRPPSRDFRGSQRKQRKGTKKRLDTVYSAWGEERAFSDCYVHATPIARFCPRLSHSFTRCCPPFRVGLLPWLSVLPLCCCVLYGRLGAVNPPSAATARTELCERGSVSTLVTTGLTPPAVPEERGGYSVRSRGVELPTVGALARSP
jgi:hypothetical protein